MLLTALAAPYAVFASIVLICGVVILMREGFSRVGWLHLLLAAAVFGWQFSVAGLLSAQNEADALVWALPTLLSVICVPTAYFHFVYALTRRAESRFDASAVAWLVTAVFAVAVIGDKGFITSIERYWWGFFPRYDVVGWLFIGYTSALILLCAYLLLRSLRSTPPGTSVRQRSRLLLAALGVSSVGALDFLPTLGIDVYPFGGLAVVFAFLLNIYTTWRHRLVQITPALAADQFMKTMSDGIMVLDHDGIVRLVNGAASDILGRADTELLHARPPADLLQALFGEIHSSRFPSVPVERREIRYPLPEGGFRILSASMSFVEDRTGDPIAAVLALQDITAARAAQEEIRRLAYYDALTGLPNRVLLKEHFAKAIAVAQRGGLQAAVLFLDLDRFKHINDTLGHDAGDQLLQAVAARVAQCVRESDLVLRTPRTGTPESTLARLGGDEFVLLLAPIEHGEDAARVALRIIEALEKPIRLRRGEEAVTGVSIGIALYPGDGTDADALLKKADIAMYHAKESGRNAVRFHDSAFNEFATNKIGLETSLRRAMLGQEFQVRYQPIVSSVTGAAVAIETQVYWSHPEKGLVSERAFRDIAHDAGVTPALNEWVIRTACLQLQSWQASGMPRAAIQVTVGAVSIERGKLVDCVREALVSTGIPPSSLWLCLRLPRARTAGGAKTRDVLRALSQLGVRLVLDDFGSGHISLDELLSQTIHMVRLEGEFLSRLPADPQAAIAVRSLLTLVTGLGIDSQAGSVDSAAVSRFLREAGCDYLIGQAHAPSLTAEEVPERFGHVVHH